MFKKKYTLTILVVSSFLLLGFTGTYILAEDLEPLVNEEYSVNRLDDLHLEDIDAKTIMYLLKNGMIDEDNNKVRDLSDEDIYFILARWLDLNTNSEYTYDGMEGFDREKFTEEVLMPAGIRDIVDNGDLSLFFSTYVN